MHKSAVIADASCLIVLGKIGQLPLLREVYGNVLITTEIVQECGMELPNWITITNPKDNQLKSQLELLVDAGEASALTLATELKNPIVILDDHKARTLARKLGVRHTGTLGVMVKAK